MYMNVIINVMTSITKLGTNDKILKFLLYKYFFKVTLKAYDKIKSKMCAPVVSILLLLFHVIKCLAEPCIFFSLFRNLFNKFNNT